MTQSTGDLAAVTAAPTLPAGALAPPARRWLAYGDAMRVLGVLAVILVHNADMILFNGGIVRSADWWAANMIDATGRWAVPVFIMLSGALLLDSSRQESPLEFYRRRLSRLGIAVLFWSIFFLSFQAWFIPEGWKQPGWLARDLMLGRPYVHLHFVFRLAGLYAITPMLRVFVKNAPLRLRVISVAIILGMGMGNAIVAGILKLESSAFMITWPFLGFYLAGNVLREVQVGRRLLVVGIIGYIVCWAGMVFGTAAVIPGWLLPARPEGQSALMAYPSTDMLLYDFLSPLRVGMSFCAWFVLAFVFGRLNPKGRLQRALAFLAPLTLGIYLVHPLFREVLFLCTRPFDETNPLQKLLVPLSPAFWEWMGRWVFERPNVWLGILVATVLVSVFSILVTYVLNRIPLVRKIIG